MSTPKAEAKPLDLGLEKPLDELFMNDKERAENRLPRIHDIPLAEIDDFPDHPYQVRMDEDMDQLVESIKEHGIITPVKLRPKPDGRYEMVSGHRRKKACEVIGLETIRAEVMDLSRDDAIILMVESNLQRTTILPSEKAAAYKMRLEAMRRQQGKRTDLTSVPVGQKLESKSTREQIASTSPDSYTQIQRYIRLNELVPGIVNMVDEGKIAMRPAVELSYLKKGEQIALLESMSYQDATPSLAQAIKLRKFSQEDRLSADVIESIMTEEKPNQMEKFTMRADRLRKYIPREVSQQKAEEFILKALEHYTKYLEKQRQNEAYER
jgi:ParB family chromosome partitioning protein